MNDEHHDQVALLRDAVSSLADESGEDICMAVEADSLLLINWIDYLSSYHLTEVANSLLKAAGSSLREAAACFSLGMVRPALFSLRSVIDLFLAWLYFKDHPIEWRLVNATGDGFLMKKEVLEYLVIHYKGFKPRLALLKQVKVRREDEPYRLLSAHIHGQSEVVLPVIRNLCDAVKSGADAMEATKVCADVSEYVSDLLVSLYASDWHALPEAITRSVDKRFASPAQRAEFWSF